MSFFRREKTVMHNPAAVIKEEVTPMVEVSRQPGLTCPECHTRIPVSIPSLLQHAPIICPTCQLVLELDADQSKGALGALQRLQDNLAVAGKQA